MSLARKAFLGSRSEQSSRGVIREPLRMAV